MGGDGTTGRSRVALTFDMEHPSRASHDVDAPRRILQSLQDAGVRATFFVQGRWARSEPALARRVATDGHLLGSHSHYHAPMVALTDQAIVRDVTSAAMAITEVTGVETRPWFRCPFGEGHNDKRVLGQLELCGYQNVHWNVEPEDWLEDCTPEQLINSVVDGTTREAAGAIVLLHTWPTVTADALPTLIDKLVARGHELVGVDTLLGDPSRDKD